MPIYIVTRLQEELRLVVGQFDSWDKADEAAAVDARSKEKEASEFGFNTSASLNAHGEMQGAELIVTQSDGEYLTSYGWEITSIG